jgi:hypothetical protein
MVGVRWGHRLGHRSMAGTSVWLIGYSMDGMSVYKCLTALPPEWRRFVVGVTTMGDPCTPPEGSPNGNDPGEGISELYQSEWVRDRYWSYSIEGDCHPRCTEPTLPGKMLSGQTPTDDPLAGTCTVGASNQHRSRRNPARSPSISACCPRSLFKPCASVSSKLPDYRRRTHRSPRPLRPH